MKINCTEKETDALFNMVDEAANTVDMILKVFGTEDPDIIKNSKGLKKLIYNGEVDEKALCTQVEAMTVIYRTVGKIVTRILPIIMEEGALAGEELEKVTEKYKE